MPAGVVCAGAQACCGIFLFSLDTTAVQGRARVPGKDATGGRGQIEQLVAVVGAGGHRWSMGQFTPFYLRGN